MVRGENRLEEGEYRQAQNTYPEEDNIDNLVPEMRKGSLGEEVKKEKKIHRKGWRNNDEKEGQREY